MNKLKGLFSSIYSSLIIPFLVTIVFPLCYLALVGKGRAFYKTSDLQFYTWVFVIGTIILLISTYITCKKQLSDCIYYAVGIIVGIIFELIVKRIGKLEYPNISEILRNILVIGYLGVGLFICIKNYAMKRKVTG